MSHLSGAIKIAVILITLPFLGAFSLMAVEGWNFTDSLYMAIITLTTVGFQEVHPLSEQGRWVIIVFLVLGLGIFLYGVAYIGEVVVRAELSELLGRRKMSSAINKISNHHIVCGFGRMGQSLCNSLHEKGEKFVVIEKESQICSNLQQREGWHVINGDVTDDTTLEMAGVSRAKGLAVVLASDADNLYVVMSARLLNKDLQILSRASDEKNELKMYRAGASRVISPYKSGAARMAQMLVNPNLSDFVEIIDGKGSEVDLAQFKITADDEYGLMNQALIDLNLTEKGIIIVGIRQVSGEFSMPPHKNYVIREGDTLIAMGKSEAVAGFIETPSHNSSGLGSFAPST